MIVIGAGGHARELLEIIEENYTQEEIVFFDNLSKKRTTFNEYRVISIISDLEERLASDKKFCLAMGNPIVRSQFFNKCMEFGGTPVSIIFKNSFVSKYAKIGMGINLMAFSSILGNAKIGDGTLINSYCSVHHDVKLGKFNEISPGCRILGGVEIKDFCSLGANSTILPNLRIGDNVIIGAGSVVTKNITQPGTYIGVPAKLIN